jgi:hypothetical protein
MGAKLVIDDEEVPNEDLGVTRVPAAPGVTPEQSRATAQLVAPQLGTNRMADPDAVARVKSIAEDAPKTEKFRPDWSGFSSGAPSLSRHLQANPDFAKGVLDHAPALAQLEATARGADQNKYLWMLKTGLKNDMDVLQDVWADVKGSYGSEKDNSELVGLRAKQVLGTSSSWEDARADALSSTRKPWVGANSTGGFFTGMPGQIAGMLGGMVGNAKAIGERVTQGVLFGGTVGSVAPGVGTAAGALTGAGVGLTAGMGEHMAQQSMGEFYDTMLHAKLPDGTNMDPRAARGAALIVGAVNGGLGVLPIAGVLSPGGFGAKLLGSAGADMLTRMAVAPGVQRALINVATKFAAGEAAQAVIGGIQELTTAAGEMGVQYWSDPSGAHGSGAYQAHLTERLPEAAKKGAQVGAVFSGFDAALHASAKSVAHYDNVSDLSKSVPLFQQDKTHLKNFIDRLASDSGMKDVTFPRAKLEEVMNAGGLHGDKLKAVMPGVAEQMERSKGDDKAEIRMTPGEVSAYVAPLDGYKQLREHLRDGNGFTLNELRGLSKQTSQDVAQLKLDNALPDYVKPIYDDVYHQLSNTKSMAPVAEKVALLYASQVQAVAEATRTQPKDIHAKYGIQFLEKLEPELDDRAVGVPGATVESTANHRIVEFEKSIPQDAKGEQNYLKALRIATDNEDIKQTGTYGEMWARLTKTTGSPQDAARVLAGLGYDGVDTGKTKRVWASDILLPKKDPLTVTRGSTTFEPGKTTVAFSQHATPATAAHELGHVFMKMWEDAVTPPMEHELKLQASFQNAKTGKVVNTGPWHDLSQLPGGTNAHASGDWVDGFTDQHAKFYTRDEASAAVKVKGKELESGGLASEDLTRMREQQARRVEANPALKSFKAWQDKYGSDPEKFAHAFVDYLRTGEAPSIALRPVFGSFKGWLTTLYGMQTALGEPLSPEMHQVFGKLLASAQAMAEAKKALYKPMFENTPEGMTEARYAKLKRALDDAAATAQSGNERELFHSMSAEGIDAFEKTKEAFKKQLIATDSTHSLVSFLKDGERLDHGLLPLESVEPVEGGTIIKHRLDTNLLRVMGVGDETLAQLEGMHEPGGIDPEGVAKTFGYDDTHDMLDKLKGYVPLDKAVAAEAAQRMPGWVDPKSWLENRSVAKLANDAVPKALFAEFEALGGKLEGGAGIDQLRVLTRNQLRHAKVSSLVPEQFLREYHRLGDEAIDAVKTHQQYAELKAEVAKKLPPGATAEDAMKYRASSDLLKKMRENGIPDPADLKRRQMVAFEGWKLARETLESQAKFNQLGQKLKDDLAWRARISGNAGREALKAVDSVISAYGFTGPEDAQSFPADKWVREQVKRGADIVQDPELDGRAVARKPVGQMDIDQLYNAQRFMESVQHHVETMNTFNGGMTPKPLAPLVERLIKHIMDRNPTVDRSERNKLLEAMAHVGRGLMSESMMGEYLLRHLDGDDPHGLLNQTIFQPLAVGEKTKFEMTKALDAALREHLKVLENPDLLVGKSSLRIRDNSYLNPITGKVVHTPGRTLTKAELLSVLLNIGTDKNRNAILRGYGVTLEEVMGAVQKDLKGQHFEFANRIWKVMEDLFPEVQRVYKQRNGVELEGVKNMPFELTDSEGNKVQMTGGYMPLKYSGDAAHVHETYNVQGFDHPDAHMNDNFTHEAKGSYGPVELSLPVVLGHVRQKVHYVSLYNAVQEVNKIISHPDFRKAIADTVGKEFNDTLFSMLRNTARDGMPTQALGFWDRAMRYVMRGVTQAALGLNVLTGYMQVDQLFPAGLKLGPRNMGEAWYNIVTDWSGSWERALKQSGELPKMGQNPALWKALLPIDPTVSVPLVDKFKELGHGKLFRSASEVQSYMQELGMAHQNHVRQLVGLWVFEAAKLDAVRENRADPIGYADAMVRQINGANGGAKDMPKVLAQPGLARSQIMFYSQLSLIANELMTAGMGFSRDGITKKTLMATTVALAGYLVLPDLLRFYGRRQDKDMDRVADGPGQKLSYVARAQVGLTLSRMLPGVGDALGEMIAPDKPGHGNVGGPIGQLAGSVRSATLGLASDRHQFDPQALANVTAVLTHTPTAQLYKNLDFVTQMLRGTYGTDPATLYSVYARGAKKEGYKR